MKTTLLLTLAILFCAGMLCAAKYVDPLNGSDANAGTIAAPWRTLKNIHLLDDTVYISNSAVCYFGDSLDRNPINVLLRPWGDGVPTIIVSNTTVGTPAAAIFMNSVSILSQLRMYKLKWTFAADFTRRLIIPRNNFNKKVIVENCEFDFTGVSGAGSVIYVQDCTNVEVRIWSNLIYRLSTSVNRYFVEESGTGSINLDMRYNRFYDFGTANGVLFSAHPLSSAIIANNTAWSGNYLCYLNNGTVAAGFTNINNVVDYEKDPTNRKWFRCQTVPGLQSFCDFNVSGDTLAYTFANTINGANNQAGLTDAQINFKNTTDVANAEFLKTGAGSAAESSAAASVYPDLNLPDYAGWAPSVPVPEPATALLACGSLLSLYLRKLRY